MRLSFLGVALGSLLSLCAFLSLVLLDQFPETVRNSTLLIVYGVLAFAAYGTIAGLVDVWIISVVRRIGDGGNARRAATAITALVLFALNSGGLIFGVGSSDPPVVLVSSGFGLIWALAISVFGSIRSGTDRFTAPPP
jgi:hypothetical protein